MPRIKLKPTVQLESWDAVDLTLSRIGELERQKAQLLAGMQQIIDDAKKDAKDKTDPITDNIAKLAAQIQAYAEGHRSEMGERKSKELTFGQLGWRSSTTLTLPSDPDRLSDLLNELQIRGMEDAIIYLQPKISKEKLREYDLNNVADLGVGVNIKDTFWLQTKQDDVHPEV
jgi:phage host-nuclease inhibitor protein Gam